MRYFKEIALWKIIVLNAMVGICVSVPFHIALLLCTGLFGPSTTNEKLLGSTIFIAIIIIIVMANYMLWKFTKKRSAIA